MPNFSDSENSDTTPPPLQVVEYDGAVEKRRSDRRKMQLVAAATAVSNRMPFELPEDWVVEVRPRPNSSMSDKCSPVIITEVACIKEEQVLQYYYEPGTGRKFRSLLSIKRYLNGEDEPEPFSRKKRSNCLVPYTNSGSLRRVVFGGKVLRLDELDDACDSDFDDAVPTTISPNILSVLPDGWIVEEVPRRCGIRCDRYYIDPETGQKFRSVPEVQRYLAGVKHRLECRALTLSNHVTAPRSRTPRKKNTSVRMLKNGFLDLTNPPDKINWVFSGDGRDNWSPLLEECVLPDYVKEQWAETFLLGMNGWKQRVPQLTMGGHNQASNA